MEAYMIFPETKIVEFARIVRSHRFYAGVDRYTGESLTFPFYPVLDRIKSIIVWDSDSFIRYVLKNTPVIIYSIYLK